MPYKNKLATAILATFFCVLDSPVMYAESLTIDFNSAVDYALKNHRAIEQSEEDRESARWNLSAIRRSFGPRLNWSLNADYIGGRYYNEYRGDHYLLNGLSPEIRSNILRSRDATMQNFPAYRYENSNTLNLSLPLYTGGDLEGRKRAATYGLNSADMMVENSKQEVKWRTAQAYYQMLRYNSVINVRREEISHLNEHLRNVQIQYQVGTVAMSDVLATNVQIANSQQALNSALGDYENAVANLKHLMGLPPDTDIKSEEDLDYEAYEEDEASCIEYALQHRPDGKASIYAVKRAEASVSSAKSGYRPNVSAVMQGSMSGEGLFQSNHNGGLERWSAGVQVSWNVFDNQVTAAQVHQAQAAQRKAESQAREQIEVIRLEVHQAYTNLKIAEQNIKVTSAAVQQAEEQYFIAKTRYEEGVDTNLVVMDAQEKLTQARTNYYIALYTYNTSRAQLEKAMGVPIGIDVSVYTDATENGMRETKALQESAISDLGIFNERGKVRRRSDEDIRPITEMSGDEKTLSEPFEPEEE